MPLGNPPPSLWSRPHSGPLPSHNEPEKGAGLSHPLPCPRRGPLCCTPGGLMPHPAAPARTPPCLRSAAAALFPLVQAPVGQEGARAAGTGPLATRSGLGRPRGLRSSSATASRAWWGSALSSRRLGCSPEVTSGTAPTPCSLPETLHRLSRFQLLSPCPLGWKPHDRGRGHLVPSVGLSRRLEQCEHVCGPACIRTDAGSAPTHPMMCCT